jgi:hypothetical protein
VVNPVGTRVEPNDWVAAHQLIAEGAASALALVAAGFGVALVSEPIKKLPARDIVFKDLVSLRPVRIPLGAVWKKNGSIPELSLIRGHFERSLRRDCLTGACSGQLWALQFRLGQFDLRISSKPPTLQLSLLSATNAE